MKTDSEIQKDVMEELKWEPFLNSSEIGVSVKSGVATLSGLVDSYSKKIAAEKAAKRVSGVKAVAEDIKIRLAGLEKKSDTEIAEALLNALKWNSAIQEDKVKIKVEDGWVTLEGEVEWEFQKKGVAGVAETLVGVMGVSNNIKIIPKITAQEIKSKIAAAFHRSATIDAEKIKVESNGNKVTLSGKVRSWSEKKEAENAAWLAPGISFVENRIEIDTDIFAY